MKVMSLQNSPYYALFVVIFKVALVLIIVIGAFIIYRKLKKKFEVNRTDITKLEFTNRNFYKQYYQEYTENPKKYTQNDVARFLRNYKYEDDWFIGVEQDLAKLNKLEVQAFWNPVQGIKNIAGGFSSSGWRQIYGANMLRGMKAIKSQIMLSIMIERYYVLTDRDLMSDIDTYMDADTTTEFYKYIKNLPISVK